MGKNVDNLDDVAQLLSRKSEQKIILKKYCKFLLW